MAECRGELGTFLALSRGLCRKCGEMVDVRYMADDQSVYLERLCPKDGKSRTLVAESLAWYLEAMKMPIAPRPPEKVLTTRKGACPQSCGPCGFHAQRCNLPVFSITNTCNLDCPICFTYNRPDKQYHMSVEEFEAQVNFVVEATGGVDLINVTGGEPTAHPELLSLLERAKRPEIGRITLNSNGILIAKRPELAEALAELGVYVILSLDTLDAERSKRIHGRDITAEKLRALENLARYGVQTTLLMVLIGGVNEDELGDLVQMALQRDHVRSLTIQTMTYTGQGGGAFEPRQHIPVDGVERRIEEASAGQLKKSQFLPLPTAHPLCYGVNYLIVDDEGRAHSLSDLLGREVVSRQLFDGYLFQPTKGLEQEMHRSIDRLWSEGSDPGLLAAVKNLLQTIYPAGENLSAHDRQRRAEKMVKTIYVHAHMDEDTYEVGRAMRCPDQVPVDAEKMIGACNYNLFYRMRDQRFWIEQ